MDVQRFEDFLNASDHYQQKIKEPSDETVVWKYLDFAKYMALLKMRTLHLAPAVEFTDRYEGDIGDVQKEALVRKYGQKRYESVMGLFKGLRERTFVSCWTENEFESDAMWRIYTGAMYGVAVQSTYGRLKKMIPKVNGNGRSPLSYCGRVNYVDFKKELLDLEHFSLPYFYKRKSFEHEREVRILVQDAEGMRLDQEAPPFQQIPLTKDEINHLIISVHLSPGAPPWFKELVGQVNEDYGLDRKPIPSALDEVPE